MEEEVDTTFQEVFLETGSIDPVRLLPWCISTATNPGALPTCYLSEALAITMQQRVEVPMAAIAPESVDPQALVFMSSSACQTETPPLPISPLSNILLMCTLPVGHSLAGLLINSQHTKWDHSPNSAPDDQPGKRGSCWNHWSQSQQWAQHTAGQQKVTQNTTGDSQQ